MSETAQTLVEGALRVIGVIATGEDPTADELADGLEAMKFMLRHWSDLNIRLYYTKQDTHVLTGVASYTIGPAGTINTVRPVSIRGARVDDDVMKIIDEATYRRICSPSVSGTPNYLWYSPEFPLGKIYIYPLGSGTLYLDSLKPLTDPTLITESIEFPPGYDEVIKFNLAIRLAPEYGKEPSATVISLALSGLRDMETRNFAEQVVSVRPEIIRLATHYNIDEG